MHLVQAKTLLPEASRVHCRLGYFLLFEVGLYLPRSLTLRQAMTEDFAQIEHCFSIRGHAIIQTLL